MAVVSGVGSHVSADVVVAKAVFYSYHSFIFIRLYILIYLSIHLHRCLRQPPKSLSSLTPFNSVDISCSLSPLIF